MYSQTLSLYSVHIALRSDYRGKVLYVALHQVMTYSPGLTVLPLFVHQVLETCVKNCGHRFHSLVTSRDFIDGVLVKIISPKNNPPTIVQDKVLALIQVREEPNPCQTTSTNMTDYVGNISARCTHMTFERLSECLSVGHL